MDKNLLQDECSRLKARVTEVENTIKEIIESIDKLQIDLDAANAVKETLENRSKIAENQVANL